MKFIRNIFRNIKYNLKHLNKSKKTRYSIAFNLIPTGVIGEGDSQLILNV